MSEIITNTSQKESVVTITRDMPKPFEIYTAILSNAPLNHKCRPVLILAAHPECGIVTVVPLSGNQDYPLRPWHVTVQHPKLNRTSRTLCEHVTTLHVNNIRQYIGCIIDPYKRYAIRHALALYLSLLGLEKRQYA